jgi:tetratricopeptide (TPR) repeat protein
VGEILRIWLFVDLVICLPQQPNQQTTKSTTMRKYSYFIVLATLLGLVFWGWTSNRISTRGLLWLALGLLLLGRAINYPLRHFYRGLNNFRLRKWDEAEQYFHVFLNDLAQRPWIRYLNFWNSGYTTNLEAMTWNNLGAIQIEKRNLDAAPEFLNKAAALDARYAKPYFNLAVTAVLKGEQERAKVLFEKATDLGYSGGAFDQFLTRVQEAYAGVNGA